MYYVCRRSGRTEDPEHETDLYVSEENVSRTKRVLECVVDVLAQSAVVVVVVGVVEQSRSGRDHVRTIIQSECGGCEQDEETEM